ncbi:MAG: replication-associated recombination protein A [Planctomycetota bacterium]
MACSDDQAGLFDFSDRSDESNVAGAEPIVPLAERLRPATFDELIGQDEAVGPGSLLRDLIETDHIPSVVFWGPPGCGKTSLARLLASKTGLRFIAFSAVTSGVKEVRGVIAEAKLERRHCGVGTLLFVDEIHRFNRSQQDAFLPHVEDGTVVLVGATTENPAFELNPALLSRCRVVVLEALGEDSLELIARRALNDRESSGLPSGIDFDEGGMKALVAGAYGDGRTLLNRLEAVVRRESELGALARSVLDAEAVTTALGGAGLRYDRSGESHFNVMSAFHKSLRGGDPQAALYWLARMLESGEDPRWVARRIVRAASEDVGLADPQALTQAIAAEEAFRRLGSPEGELALAQAAVYIATAPKSNAVYAAFNAARDAIKKGEVYDVPNYLKNSTNRVARQLDFGKGYEYPHDFDQAVSGQNYLPKAMAGRRFYQPSPYGFEKDIGRRMAYWDGLIAKLGAAGTLGKTKAQNGRE